MGKVRKQFGKEFKAKVAIEALKGNRTIAEISSEYGVHPNQISQWKNILKEGLPGLFETGKSSTEKNQEDLIEDLYKNVGQLQVENAWLKKKLPF